MFKFINYLKRGVRRIRLNHVPEIQSFFIRYFRIILLVIRRYKKNQCELRASSLTFYTVLSIVPIFAMAFGISKGIGAEKILESQLFENFPGQEEVIIRIINIARSLLESTKGGMIAGIGLAVLFWTVLRVLSNIEKSMNIIWEISESRHFGRKVSDYLCIIMICPLLIGISSSVNLFITTQVTAITENIPLLGFVTPLIFFFLKFLPYCLIWMLFTIIYILMPNTKVNFFSGLFAGILAGTIYQLAQWVYIRFQVGVANYNAIYGSFAALPLFLVWLQLSWLIVLFGAEISFAHQHRDTYEFDPDCTQISFSLKKFLALQIVTLLTKRFLKGEEPLTTRLIAGLMGIPLYLSHQILSELVECKILSVIRNEEDSDPAYQPACDIQRFTVKYIIDALEQKGMNKIQAAWNDDLQILSESLQTFRNDMENSSANLRLKDI